MYSRPNQIVKQNLNDDTDRSVKIITSYFSSGYESVEAIAVRNKVIERFIHSHPVVEIEGSLWPCAGPGLIQASEKIAIAIDNLS